MATVLELPRQEERLRIDATNDVTVLPAGVFVGTVSSRKRNPSVEDVEKTLHRVMQIVTEEHDREVIAALISAWGRP